MPGVGGQGASGRKKAAAILANAVLTWVGPHRGLRPRVGLLSNTPPYQQQRESGSVLG